MPHQHSEFDREPEPEPSSSRTGGPPHKSTGIGIVDPPPPPSKRPVLKWVVIFILIGAAVAGLFWFTGR
jgi:hypothetical protein